MLPDWYRPTQEDVAAIPLAVQGRQLLQRLRNIPAVAAATTNPTAPTQVIEADRDTGEQRSWQDFSNQRFHAVAPPIPSDYNLDDPGQVRRIIPACAGNSLMVVFIVAH